MQSLLEQDSFFHVLTFLTPKELFKFQILSKHCKQISNLPSLWYEVSRNKIINICKFTSTKMKKEFLPSFDTEINWKQFYQSLKFVCFSTGYNGGPTDWGIEKMQEEPDFGQLGLELDHKEILKIQEFTLIPGLIGKEIVNVQCGGFHTLALSKNGEVYAFGSNTFGQLGLGDRKSRSTPTKLNLKNIKSIHCGYAYSCAINQSGECFGWGFNKNGRAGHSDTESKWISSLGKKKYAYVDTPMFIKEFEGIKIKKIACGSGHTIFLDYEGNVYGIGRNDVNQLGGFRQNVDEINDQFILDLPHKSDEYIKFKNPFLKDIIDIACLSYSSAFLNHKNILFACGGTNVGDSPMEIDSFVENVENFHGSSSVLYAVVGGLPYDTIDQRWNLGKLKLKYVTGASGVKYSIEKNGKFFTEGEDFNKYGLLGRTNLNSLQIEFPSLEINFEMVSVGYRHVFVN
jgi:hypothetical protein